MNMNSSEEKARVIAMGYVEGDQIELLTSDILKFLMFLKPGTENVLEEVRSILGHLKSYYYGHKGIEPEEAGRRILALVECQRATGKAEGIRLMAEEVKRFVSHANILPIDVIDEIATGLEEKL